MKKFLIATILLAFCTIPVQAEVILAPQWSEFCPVSFLTVPATVKTKDKKYWYERRVQFEVSLARCNPYSGDDLKDCYQQVRLAEQNKNKIWDAKVQQNYQDLDKLYQRNQQIEKYNLIRDVVNSITK